jgi:hypothetical protein
MKLWLILKNKKSGIYNLINKDIINDSTIETYDIIKELDGEISFEDARNIYVQFLDNIFPVNKHLK